MFLRRFNNRLYGVNPVAACTRSKELLSCSGCHHISGIRAVQSPDNIAAMTMQKQDVDRRRHLQRIFVQFTLGMHDTLTRMKCVPDGDHAWCKAVKWCQ